MSQRTVWLCDCCNGVIDETRPAFYLTTKRAAPSIDADLCSPACVSAFAVRLALKETSNASSEVTT